MDYEAGDEEGGKDASNPKQPQDSKQEQRKDEAAQDEPEGAEGVEEINEDGTDKHEDRQFANPQVEDLLLHLIPSATSSAWLTFRLRLCGSIFNHRLIDKLPN